MSAPKTSYPSPTSWNPSSMLLIVAISKFERCSFAN